MRIRLCFMALAPLLASAAEIPLEDFAREDKVTSLSLSPDGRYLAETRLLDGHSNLVVVRLSDRKVTAAYDFGDERRTSEFWWVGPERLVAAFAEAREAFVQPIPTGELIGFDADASKGDGRTYLFGARGYHRFTDTRIPERQQRQTQWAQVIRSLPGEPRWALVQLNDFNQFTLNGQIINNAHVGSAEVDRIDVNTGLLQVVDHAPIPGETRFLADHSGKPRYSVTEDAQFRFRSFIKPQPQDEWKPLDTRTQGPLSGFPDAISTDDQRIFLRAYPAGDRLCVEELPLASAEPRVLSCDAQADAGQAILSFDGQEVISVLYRGVPPWQRLVDTHHPDRARLQSLQQAFPGQIVDPVSVAEDGSKAVLYVHSDRNPGDYYLFDPKTLKADYLESRRDWIDPEQMSERRAIEYKSRDGQVLHGILTLPHGKEAKHLPLVVLPHGGPFGILDDWGWAAEPQMLASRGYAVLQVNFRGSGGYGLAFRRAGEQQWDSVMIDDVTDGTRWVLAQGYADGARVCIYGASYGGYAALMSAVKEPDLYRCAVGYAGVYDLVSWKQTSDVSEAFISQFVGADDTRLAAASPLAYIDRLKAAVMIVHGEADRRVPFSQAKLLRAALDARQKTYVWLSKPGEGHGFYDEKNRVEFYDKLVTFLDAHIGAASTRAATSSQAPAANDMAASPATR